MRNARVLLCYVCCVLFALGAAAQQAPGDVTYKAAPDELNETARAGLQKALTSDEFPGDLLKQTFTCGPMLWKALKPSADRILLESKEIVGFVQTPEPTQVDLLAMNTLEQRRSFWKTLVKKYPALKTAKVRKASANEISYYWATIPFDIDEPFFAIDTGTEVFVAHFGAFAPALFWIDLVDDLGKLKAK